MNEQETWEDKYNREHRERLEKVKAEAKADLAKLRELGVTSIELQYDGEGDSGAIEGITFLKGQDDPLELERDNEPIENLAYAILEKLHSGWEVNDGSYGTLRFDLTTQKVKVDHAQRVTETIETINEASLLE